MPYPFDDLRTEAWGSHPDHYLAIESLEIFAKTRKLAGEWTFEMAPKTFLQIAAETLKRQPRPADSTLRGNVPNQVTIEELPRASGK